MHRNKEIILHFSIQILFIKFKSPRFVRIRAFFFAPKSSQQAYESTGQQANEPTSFQRSDEAEGSETPILSIKNPINTHFLTNIITPPSLTDFSKKAHTDSTDSTKQIEMACYLLTCWLVDSLTLNKIGVNWILMDLIGVKISHSHNVVWGMMWQLPNLWWGFGSCDVGIPLCI